MTSQSKILIVEDDLDVAEMLRSYFSTQGYTVETSAWGEDAVRACLTQVPDLVVLDIRLPDIDGYEVARQLRHHRRTEALPIVFLTEKRDRSDKLRGLEMGVVDYLTKPFDMTELRLRVRNAIRRAQMGATVHPVTGLPEGSVVDERLSQLLKSGNWGLLLVSVHGLDDFRETFGFVASDDVLRAVGMLVHNAMRETGGAGDFLGHLDGEDFLAVVREARLRDVRERVTSRLTQSVEYFYPLQHRLSGKPAADGPLHFALRGLTSADGPFENVAHLKTTLLRLRSA